MTHQTYTLDQLGRFQRGLVGTRKRLGTGEAQLPGEGTRVRAVDLTSISSGEIDWDRLKTVNPSGDVNRYYVQENDLVLALRPPFRPVYVRIVPAQAVVTGPILLFRVDQNFIIPEYAAWVLGQPSASRQVERRTEGTVISFYSPKVIRNIEIAVPPLEIQQRIAIAWRLSQRVIRLERRRLQAVESLHRAQSHLMLSSTTKTTSPDGTN